MRPDLVPYTETKQQTSDTLCDSRETTLEGHYSDRSSVESDSDSERSTVVSNRDYCHSVNTCNSNCETPDELCHVRGTEETEIFVETVRSPPVNKFLNQTVGSQLLHLPNIANPTLPSVPQPSILSPKLKRYYLTVIVLLYIGKLIKIMSHESKSCFRPHNLILS